MMKGITTVTLFLLPSLCSMSRQQLLAVTLLVAVIATTSSAQSVAKRIAQGDKEYAALHPVAALAQYEAALATEPKNVDALWKASLAAVAIGEFLDTTHTKLFEKGAAYGRRAVQLDSTNAQAQFALAQALGRITLTMAMMARAPYAHEVYEHATTCLKLDPKSAECMHVLGLWHAEAMRVPGTLRTLAIKMLGVKELGTASWEQAEHYLEAAVKAQPNRAIHHYDLGHIYVDTKDIAKAKVEFEATLKAPVCDFNDKYYKEGAKKALQELAKQG